MKAELQSFISDFLNGRNIRDRDGFSIKAAEALCALEDWEMARMQAALTKVKTDLFLRNPNLGKDPILCQLSQKLAKRFGPRHKKQPREPRIASTDKSVHFHGMVNAQVIQTGDASAASMLLGSTTPIAQRVAPSYLDGLAVLEKVPAHCVKDVLAAPVIKVPEREVRAAVESSLGEAYSAADSGVETCDMFTLQATHQRQPLTVAAMFKGAGDTSLRWPLKVAGCGKNGDQVVRLFEVPADLYLIQANGPIDPNLAKHIDATARAAAVARGNLLYAIMDGVTTARFLRAVNKI